MVRFFADGEELRADTVVLTGENAQHARVLRLKAGETVLVCDGQGTECLCQVADAGEMRLNVLERRESISEAAVRVSVYMAFPKADKLEHVIQKATELGAYEIVAFPSARCVSRPDEKSLKKKLERWQKIAASAAEQSGRGRIPQVLVLDSFHAALSRASEADKALMFYENEQAVTLKMALSGEYRTVSLAGWKKRKSGRQGKPDCRSARWENGFCGAKQRRCALCLRSCTTRANSNTIS